MTKREKQQGSAANTTDSMKVIDANGNVLFQGPMADSPNTPIVPLDRAEDGDVLGIAHGSEYDPND